MSKTKSCADSDGDGPPLRPPPPVVHNFIDKRQTKKGGIKTITTPATRLGLAQAPLTYGDVIYFSA